VTMVAESDAAGDDVGDDFGILGIGDGGFEDADDGGRADCPWARCQAGRFLPRTRIFIESSSRNDR